MTNATTPAGGTHGTLAASRPYDIVVFCHLRWDFVYQRPQHIISRLAQRKRVLLVEEPWHRPEQSGSSLRSVQEGLDVLQPNVTDIGQVGSIVTEYAGTGASVGWFYSPAFIGVLTELSFDQVVYDCMDELSLFRGAPAQLIEQERMLLRRADVVFTGGRSLYEAKAELHDDVHCFPSSVDQDHFARALKGLPVPDDMAALSRPIVGYFGVIDERIDLALLDGTAELLPDVQFVMIGPLAKISPDDLPRRSNLHYPGMRDYQQLPNYLQCFDVAMMPFALNDATKFISPTKTLEYMAAGRPIVSTAIRDVVREYADVVQIVNSPTSFAEAVRSALAEASAPDYTAILTQTSWDATVRRMESIIAKQPA
ncbi:glycosyltransferase involved in cell wall biosynthesis [Lewinella aquimaris]|uniref:Glycosyltransferase involved in cell wall biosynthesis n=1 Tax=Neolewinella aquimaris TaxID=1835722 RepID=A0A840DXG1_9BACT|nr:glycosyltransferase [Neolewinella aquimaris]MBB4077620.1 glycosyltransferase involved in cell wall biosynthesis [Neolewinella aquimaris]